MKSKSKFLAFLLSFIPGLGHIYLGLLQRGSVYLIATGFVFLVGLIFRQLQIFYDPIPFMILPFIWLAALVESMNLADRINIKSAELKAIGADPVKSSEEIEKDLGSQNSKILTLTFSIIPGAGHMFAGQMEKGVQLMAAFFLTLYLSDFLNLSLLLMLAPLLWFYSIFDILHWISDPGKPQESTLLGDLIRDNQFSVKTGKYLGMGLIAIGCILIFNNIIMPEIAGLLNDQVREYLRTGVIAFLFIAGGIKLMFGKKIPAEQDDIKAKGENQV